VQKGSKRRQILNALPTPQIPKVETNGTQIVRTVFFPNGQAMDRIQGYADPSGRFIRQGVWECWEPGGTRTLYGHFEEDEHHGRRFEWDCDGKLIAIAAYDRGELCEYESENLEHHPDFGAAQRLLTGDGPPPAAVLRSCRDELEARCGGCCDLRHDWFRRVIPVGAPSKSDQLSAGVGAVAGFRVVSK